MRKQSNDQRVNIVIREYFHSLQIDVKQPQYSLAISIKSEIKSNKFAKGTFTIDQAGLLF